MEAMIAEAATTSSAFDILLVVHVLVGVVAVMVLVAAYVAAASLGGVAADSSWSESSRRFFSPGPDIAGRSVYLVPLTGLGLLFLSNGAFSLADPFVGMGSVLSLGAIVAGEAFVFPASSRLRALVHNSSVAPADDSWRSDLARLRWGVDAMVLAVVITAVLMVAKP